MLDPPEACIENCTSMWPLPLDRTVVVLFAGLPIIAPTSDQTSGGSIMLPVQRQVPTAFPKAAVSAGSGLGAGGPALFLATLGPFFFAGALSAFGGGPPFCAGATLVSSDGGSTGLFSCAAAASEAARTNVAIRTMVAPLSRSPRHPYQSARTRARNVRGP